MSGSQNPAADAAGSPKPQGHLSMTSAHHAYTRRQFLARSAGLTTLLALPGRSFATGQPPSERVRVGFSGIGWHGINYLGKFAKYAAAICDVDKARLREGAAIVEKA